MAEPKKEVDLSTEIEARIEGEQIETDKYKDIKIVKCKYIRPSPAPAYLNFKIKFEYDGKEHDSDKDFNTKTLSYTDLINSKRDRVKSKDEIMKWVKSLLPKDDINDYIDNQIIIVELMKKNRYYERLKIKYEKINEQKIKLDEDITALKADKTKNESEILDLQKRSENLKKELSDADVRMKEMQREVTATEEKSREVIRQRDELLVMVDGTIKEIATNREQINRGMEYLNKLEEEIKNKKVEINKKDEEIRIREEAIKDLKEFPQKSLVVLQEYAQLIDELRKKQDLTIQVLHDFMSENNTNAVILEKLRGTQSNPINYRMKLLTYEDGQINEENITDVKKTIKEIENEINKIELSDAEKQELERNGYKSEADMKMGLYRAEIINKLKAQAQDLLKNVNKYEGNRMSSSVSKFKTMTQKQKLQLIKSIKI
jgi:predicted  nucleic acid-binding Zn-ribbon protein